MSQPHAPSSPRAMKERWFRAIYPQLTGVSRDTDRRVLIQLTQWAVYNDDPTFGISIFQLGQRCGIGYKAAQRVLQRFCKAGYLEPLEPADAKHAAVYGLIPQRGAPLGPRLNAVNTADRSVPKDHPAFTRGALSGSGWAVLTAMVRGSLTRNQLLEELQCSGGALSKYLKRLRDRGLVYVADVVRDGGRGRPVEVYALADDLHERLDDVAEECGCSDIKSRRLKAWKRRVLRLRWWLGELDEPDPGTCKYDQPCGYHGGHGSWCKCATVQEDPLLKHLRLLEAVA